MHVRNSLNENSSLISLNPWILLLIAIAIASSIIACEEGASKQDQTFGDSAVAIVGGHQVTLSDINAELNDVKNRGKFNPDAESMTRQQVEEALIDREILRRQAIREKIDLDPAVQQAIERAKAKILAQAYLQMKIMQVKEPTPAAIDEYFRLHYAAYTKRKLVRIEQIELGSNAVQSELKDMASESKSLAQIITWLNRHKFAFRRTESELATDALAPELAEKVEGLTDHGLYIANDGGQFRLCSITTLRESPETKEEASAQIEKILADQNAYREILAEIARLRSLATVVYRGVHNDEPNSARWVALRETALQPVDSDVTSR